MDCRIIQGLKNVPASLRGCVLTVGNFDGVHLGHQRILTVARELADSTDSTLCVLTFDPAPAAALGPKGAHEYVVPAWIKYRLLAEYGAEVITVVKATRRFLAASPEKFVRNVLVRRFRPKHIVEGPNFFFGHNRIGNVETLRKLAGQFGFDVTVVQPLEIDMPGGGRMRISSSLVRGLVRSGDVAAAARRLGRPFTLYGRVVAGHRRGRLLEFPTANVDPDDLVSPADGVYAAKAEIDGRTCLASVSIGARATFGTTPRAIEAHLLDAEGDFYEKPIAVTFLARLRDQKTFADAEALKAQIEKDVQRVREMCG